MKKVARLALRKTFRHGDLRNALLQAGIEMARAGGPQAVMLREATRRVGVAPNAAYRHFVDRDDLVQQVRAAALGILARAIEAEIERTGSGNTPSDRARASLRAVGTAYLQFARSEPGLFRTAFTSLSGMDRELSPAKAGESGLDPFELLGAALDQLVATGALPHQRRPGAEYLAWSAVHGLAFLILEGPLGNASSDELAMLTARVVQMVENGL